MQAFLKLFLEDKMPFQYNHPLIHLNLHDKNEIKNLSKVVTVI